MVDTNRYKWELAGSNAGVYVGSAIEGAIRPLVEEQFSDLVDMFPFLNTHVCFVLFENGWWATIAESKRSGVHVCGFMEGEMLDRVYKLGQSPYELSHTETQIALLGSEKTTSRFAYIGRYQDGKADWPDFYQALFKWMDATVLPDILKKNAARVARALPSSPEFDIELIKSASVILECEKESNQGSAFALDGVGFLTCEHVLGTQTEAFIAADPASRYPVSVVKRNSALDIAILSIEGLETSQLKRADSTKLNVLSPVAVYGYPNYRLGDTGSFMPGHVVGHRSVSTVRRILTNASIVQGASGGACVDRNNEVVGIAVTGARSIETSDGTENHGIVPIEAIDILLSDS